MEMESFDISSVFISKNRLDELYRQVPKDAGKVDFRSQNYRVFDFDYKTPNQITTVKVENGENFVRHRILTYASAQNYYKSAKAELMKPEIAERVRLSANPKAECDIAPNEYEAKKDIWNDVKVDIAFKANWLKFTQNKDYAIELLRTDGHEIVVSGAQNDWMTITVKMLMVIRENLKQTQVITLSEQDIPVEND